MADNTKCPNCGKNTLVRCTNNLFYCPCCNFPQKPQPNPKSENGILWASVIAGTIVLLFLQEPNYNREMPNPENPSSPTPTAMQNSSPQPSIQLNPNIDSLTS